MRTVCFHRKWNVKCINSAIGIVVHETKSAAVNANECKKCKGIRKREREDALKMRQGERTKIKKRAIRQAL